MKKNKKLIIVVLMSVLLLTGCTKQLKDADGNVVQDDKTKQVLVEKGNIEHTELTTAYIIKEEATVEKDQNKVLMPVVAQGSKIAKGSIIATYKSETYMDYEETLAQMDQEILTNMKDLPPVYSSEVDALDLTIYNLLKQSMEETSYNKMQEYKQKINTNINKRATIIGELSPAGADIRKLIEKRNNYEANAKKTNDNILAPITGLVVYNTDGLEEILKSKNITNITYDEVKKQVEDNAQINNTKIKVVNNYEAYIIIQADKSNKEYIAEGYDYRVRFIEQDGLEIIGTVESIKEKEDNIEVILKFTNGIENIATIRKAEVEIIWDHYEGLMIPKNAVFEKDGVSFVSVILYADRQNIPVKVRIENKTYAIIKNYNEEELEKLGLSSDYKVTLYDRIVIDEKNGGK